jgi:hypothetical protein
VRSWKRKKIYVSTLTTWPEFASVGVLQEAIALLEKKVVIDQPLLGFLVHSLKRIVLPFHLTIQTLQRPGKLPIVDTLK